MTYRFTEDDSAEECSRFSWRMLPCLLLPAALCQHRHKQDACHYWSQGAQSWKQILLRVLREILSDEAEDLIDYVNGDLPVSVQLIHSLEHGCSIKRQPSFDKNAADIPWHAVIKRNHLIQRGLLVIDKSEFSCFEYKIWKRPFFCLKMLVHCWIQTIFEAKWSWTDPAVFQPFCCVFKVALRWKANTAAAVIVHTQIHLFLI